MIKTLGLSKIFDLLKPDPYVKEIRDSEAVEKNYKYWRMRIFYSMFVGYAFFYLTRKSFTFAMPAMIQDLGFAKSELGLLATILSLAYGLSKFVSGILADRSNPRYFMAFALILTGVLNILFGMSSSLMWLAIFWGLNGFFQGGGWPPCARYLTHWYSQNERGRWWSVWNASHNIGGAAIPIFATFLAQHWGWRYAMFIPGVMCIFMGLLLINRLRDTPQSLGLPSIEKFRNDYPEGQRRDQVERELSSKEILFKYVLNNPFIWILAISNFFLYIVRIAVYDWSALFLVETKAYSQLGSGTVVGWFEIGGIAGSLLAGWMSDCIFRGRRGPVNVLFSIAIILSIMAFRMVPPGHPWLDTVSMFMVGVWVFGPQMLIGVAAAELAYKKAAATSSGFTGLFGYIGSAMAGYPLGKICQDWGWDGFFMAVTGCAIASFALLIPLWSLAARGTQDTEAELESDAEPSFA